MTDTGREKHTDNERKKRKTATKTEAVTTTVTDWQIDTEIDQHTQTSAEASETRGSTTPPPTSGSASSEHARSLSRRATSTGGMSQNSALQWNISKFSSTVECLKIQLYSDFT